MATDEENLQLERLGILYWDLNHKTLEVDTRFKAELSNIKKEMKEIEKTFKTLRNKLQVPASIGDYAYKSLEAREALKITQEDKLRIVTDIISDMTSEDLLSIPEVLRAVLEHYEDNILEVFEMEDGNNGEDI